MPPKLPKLPNADQIMSIIDKADGAFDLGMRIIDKVGNKMDKLGLFDETSTTSNPSTETAPTQNTIRGATDEITLQYQLEHILAPLRQLEIHLSEGCRLLGTACDCCQKSAYDIRTFSQETIPIAARMGMPTSTYLQLVTWAAFIEEIGTPEQVASGRYDDTYLVESGTASGLRKTVQNMIADLKKGGSEEEECDNCEELRTKLSDFIAEKKKEIGGES